MTSTTRSLRSPLLVLFVLAASLSPALAQDEDPAVADADTEGDYTSPDREHCEEELRKDHRWRANLRGELRAAVHEEDAQAMLTNKKHVVYAYAALWVLTIGFVVFMWIRQQKLKETIAALERDIARAALDDDEGRYDDVPHTD